MMQSQEITRLHRKLARLTRQQEFSGAVLVRQGDVDLLKCAYGLADRTWGVKNRVDTRFRIASVGKLFTAAAVMQLVEAGKISLETRIVEALDLRGTQIPSEATVYHLLTMTSGITDYIDEDSVSFDADWVQFCREHPLYLLRKDLDYLPTFINRLPAEPLGAKHHYNGAGFILMGLLIEKVTGLSYFDYVRQNIFAPAGMTATDFNDLDEALPNVSEGYIPLRDAAGKVTGWKRNIYAVTAGPAADGGATSTLDDLARFIRVLREGDLVSPELARSIYTPQVVENPENYLGYQWHYGFGCFVLLEAAGQTLRWGPTGEEDGVSCRLWHYPRQNVDVVILGNQSACAGKVSRLVQEMVFAM